MQTYDAFISYNHNADGFIASRLQSQMQRLGKPWYRLRALRIFRDDTSLSATPGLEASLESVLGHTEFLILLASPEAARSRWVSGEVQYWLANKSVDKLLIGLTEGDLKWTQATGDFSWSEQTPLPASLKAKFGREPRWIDLRPLRDPNISVDKFLPAAAEFSSAIRGVPKEDLFSQELTQQRRAKTLAWSAAASLLLLACAAAWEWRQAVLQRDRAENTLLAAVDSTKDLVLRVGVELRQTVGIPLKVVDDIVRTAGELQTQLLKYNASSADLRRAQAVTYRERSQALSAEGKFEDALVAAQQSQQILRSGLDVDPTNADFRRELSMSDNRIGEAYSKLGRHPEALDSFLAALDIRKGLAAESANSDRKRDLAVAYERVGDEYFILKNPTKASEMYAEGLPLRESLAEGDSADLGRLEDLAVAYDRIARRSEGSEALKWVEKSLELRAKLVEAEPANALWQSNYATMLDTKGNMLAAGGDCDHALGPLQHGFVIRRSLAERNGDVPQNQANLAMSEYHLANCGDQSRSRYSNAIDILGNLERRGSLPPDVRGLREVAKSRLDALSGR
jgi:tetratricopeptide (TPR) repeat protein